MSVTFSPRSHCPSVSGSHCTLKQAWKEGRKESLFSSRVLVHFTTPFTSRHLGFLGSLIQLEAHCLLFNFHVVLTGRKYLFLRRKVRLSVVSSSWSFVPTWNRTGKLFPLPCGSLQMFEGNGHVSLCLQAFSWLAPETVFAFPPHWCLNVLCFVTAPS